MKFNLLIAEDEKICRCSIANEIQSNLPSFEVYQAANGQEALDLIASIPIDCLLLDIKMPKMSGIELLERLRELGRSEILTVVLSGFNDFAYAKTALQNNVVDYILKPVTPREILDVCRRLLEMLEEKLKKDGEYDALRKTVEAAKPMLRHQLFQNLVSGHFSAEQLYQQAEFLGIALRGGGYLCAVLENRLARADDFEEAQIMILRLKSLVLERSEQSLGVELFQLQSDQLVLLFHFGGEPASPYDSVMALLRQIRELADEVLHMPIAIGVGTVQLELSRVGTSYFHAQNALRFTTLYGDTVAYEATDLSGKKRCFECFDTGDAEVLLRTGNRAGAAAFIDRLLTAAEEQNIGATSLYILCNKLQAVVIQVLDECGIDIFQFFRPERLSFSALMELKTYEQVRHWMEELTDFAVERIREGYAETQNHVVEAVKRQIQEQYREPLNTAMLADQMGYSANYLGQVFRRVEGTSISEFICDVRLQRAKRLLLNSTYRVSEISDLVGFSSNQYFGTVFKKKTGVTPKEYREHHLTGK